MTNTAHLRTVSATSMALGWAGAHTVTIDRPEAAGGAGLGFSGVDLLLLAVGACYGNDLLREAARRDLPIDGLRIDVEGAWSGDPARIERITVALDVQSPAGDAAIADLIRHVDATAAIPLTLRHGAALALAAPPAGPDTPPTSDALLDMRGAAETASASCAILTPAIKQRLRELAAGQVLEVWVDDPSARQDIASWCRLAGHTLVAAVTEDAATARYFIRKNA